ncbi:hypothetical protein [Bacillus badius]|uniref:hypothetical protein n=1 Tax=Bacillus badius TaxID=1455 RepID=UPI0005ADA426|nr:hypothetical protein [Bacillus badius]KIL74384.1 hypothetical protein SD78_1453 [Bacillus badius]
MTKTDDDSKVKAGRSTKIIDNPKVQEEFKKKLLEHFPERIIRKLAEEINKRY